MKKVDYHTPKKAFDEVIGHYSDMPSAMKTQGIIGSGGGGSPNPAKPSASDFKCDVEAQIAKVIKNRKHLIEFYVRYIMGLERLSKEDQKVFNRYEQRLGRLFIEHQIWPVRKYMVAIRKAKGR